MTHRTSFISFLLFSLASLTTTANFKIKSINSLSCSKAKYDLKKKRDRLVNKEKETSPYISDIIQILKKADQLTSDKNDPTQTICLGEMIQTDPKNGSNATSDFLDSFAPRFFIGFHKSFIEKINTNNQKEALGILQLIALHEFTHILQDKDLAPEERLHNRNTTLHQTKLNELQADCIAALLLKRIKNINVSEFREIITKASNTLASPYDGRSHGMAKERERATQEGLSSLDAHNEIDLEYVLNEACSQEKMKQIDESIKGPFPKRPADFNR